ncbi:MAG: polyphosphate:AMP phosphotransferase [Geminicoccaceae bacterium]|nr:polyphosphate:AMP phosphotransferase [Geminicoccaceae bacterium]HRY26866.1 polyphosphate:AMP phosphotransferase [Geminicoccaceae bacterium]
MFESAAVEHVVDEATFKREVPLLRTALLEAQFRLREAQGFPVIVLVTGQDMSGKGQVMHRLTEWLDPRYLRINAYVPPHGAELERPAMWRYWRDLPPAGEIGLVFGSWYNDALRAALDDRDGSGLDDWINRINAFEGLLGDEGALILKFLLRISPEERKRREKRLKKAAYPSRHVLEEWTDLGPLKKIRPVADEIVTRTSTALAPWLVLPADDPAYRDLLFGRTIRTALEKRLEGSPPTREAPPALVPSLDGRTVLDALDLTLELDRKTYGERLPALQYRLAELTDSRAFDRCSLVCVFEGNDAAGKGGAIRRFTAALDPRRYRVWPIGAPTDDEKRQAYLWRFWRRVPRLGRTAVFDRSWYGRVLVERVEGYASEPEWHRAYGEINEFEAELTRHGCVVVKFWLATSPEEQLRRFEARADTAWKQHKITPEDWRNRQKWDAYAQAVSDMVDRTSTAIAPWTLVEAEDKRWARIKVLETIADRLERALSR